MELDWTINYVQIEGYNPPRYNESPKITLRIFGAIGRLYYFRHPNPRLNADSPIAPYLGSMFADLDRVVAPLNQDQLIPIPENLRNKSGNESFTAKSSSSVDLSATLTASDTATILCAKDENILAFGRNTEYKCDLLVTDEFEPADDFLREALLASPKAQEIFQRPVWKTRKVYMVTGLLIATGLQEQKGQKTRIAPRLSINAGALGFPAALEAALEFEVSVDNTEVWGRAVHAVVFAYRVVKITEKRDGSLKSRLKRGGKTW